MCGDGMLKPFWGRFRAQYSTVINYCFVRPVQSVEAI